MKRITRVLAALAATVLLGGCPDPQPPPAPDYTPVGDGMKAIGISLVVFGVVQALARLVMAEDQKPKAPPPKPPKPRGPRQNKKPKGGG